MAALIHLHAPFQAVVHSSKHGNRRALVCRAEARDEGAWSRIAGGPLLAAGLAATILISAPAPANAGVVVEQPKLKRQRAFQKSDKPLEPAPEQQSSGSGGLSLPSLPSLPTPSLPGLPTSFPFPALPEIDTTGGIDPRSIALPGAVVGIAAAAFAAYSLDSGFRSMIREGLVKDSTGYAGYEETIKGDPNSTQYIGPAVKGTKKVSISRPVKKATGKGSKGGKIKETKKGGVFGLFN